ncbi:hypothetical protein MMC10_006521 [Thelotrema lepadinum]|nr:hypothetical protein [Thelotrema lepadinum]
MSSLLGTWCGTTKYDSFEHYMELEIFAPSNDPTRSHLRLLKRAYEDPPARPIEWETPQHFQCKIPHWFIGNTIVVNGQYDESLQILTLSIDGSIFSWENYSLELHRNDPNSRKFRRAAESLDYTYRVPCARPDEDYFKPGNAADYGLNIASMKDMVNALLRLNSGEKNDAQVDGILVLKDCKLVLEEYFWGLAAEDIHDISSSTKSVTSILVGIAWDQGLVDLEDVVSDAFPEIETDWGKGEPVRLKHVLSMTSGTAVDEDQALEVLKSDRIAELVLSAKRTAQPGTVYQYDNNLPILAGLYLERKSRVSVEDFAAKHLFQPLDIQNPRWMHMRQKSVSGCPFVMTSGAVGLTLRNFAKLGQMMLDRGVYQGRKILSEEWIELSTKQHTLPGQWPYGFYWHLNTETQRHLSHFDGFLALGQGEQVIAVIPRFNMVITWMSSTWVNKFGYRVGMKAIDDKFVSKMK